MPNWCENEITITGNKEVIDELLIHAKMPTEGVEDPKFLMGALVPMPSVEFDNWYDWRVEHWGTKWDFNQHSIDLQISQLNPTTTQVYFYTDTAWAPPLEFWKALTKKYKGLRVENYYCEEGVGFVGIAKFKDGKMRNKEMQITSQLYEKAGATLVNGAVDWDIEQNYDFRKVLK